MSLVNGLTQEIFKEDNSNIDSFWQNMATNYFLGLVLILFDKFENSINLSSQKKEIKKIELGNDSDYPLLTINKCEYTNFKKLIEKMANSY